MAVSPRAFSRLALANFIAFFAVIATGAAVRLTGSGLGCLDWPTCSMHRAIAPLGDLHAVIEDGNRAVSGLLVALTLVTIVAAVVRSPRRSDLVWLSAGLVLGVVADALLGAVVVYTKLNPWLVSVHMALSLATLVLAAVLHHRATHRYGSDARHDLRYPPSVVLARSLWVLLAATLLAGMVTTGSGPHSGSVSHDVVKRLPFPLYAAAWVHSGCAIAFISVAGAAFLLLAHTGAAAKVTNGAKRLFVVGVAQGLVGVVQYTTHLPALLVELHVIGAAAITVGVLHFQLAQVARDPEVGLERAHAPEREPTSLVAL